MAVEYSGAILAPMVRVGTLPTRLLSLREGAQLVYSEEIIDHRLMNCRKFEIKKNGVYWIDFKLSEVDNPVFQTCKEEEKKAEIGPKCNDCWDVCQSTRPQIIMVLPLRY